MLGVSGRTRLVAVPEVPTFAEAGIPIDGTAWYALYAPARTPASLVTALSAAAKEAMSVVIRSGPAARTRGHSRRHIARGTRAHPARGEQSLGARRGRIGFQAGRIARHQAVACYWCRLARPINKDGTAPRQISLCAQQASLMPISLFSEAARRSRDQKFPVPVRGIGPVALFLRRAERSVQKPRSPSRESTNVRSRWAIYVALTQIGDAGGALVFEPSTAQSTTTPTCANAGTAPSAMTPYSTSA